MTPEQIATLRRHAHAELDRALDAQTLFYKSGAQSDLDAYSDAVTRAEKVRRAAAWVASGWDLERFEERELVEAILFGEERSAEVVCKHLSIRSLCGDCIRAAVARASDDDVDSQAA